MLPRVPTPTVVTAATDRLFTTQDPDACVSKLTQASAMSRVRRGVSLEHHTPEAINYLSTVLKRDLPQPEPGSEVSLPDVDTDAEEEDVGTSREPKVRGRPPIFENGQRSIASLISDIEQEVIALPELQRPFVWEDTKVRDLLDSLFVGFPVGTLVFWHTSVWAVDLAVHRIMHTSLSLCQPRH